MPSSLLYIPPPKPDPGPGLRRSLLLLLAIAAATGLASAPRIDAAVPSAAASLVWPPPPKPPLIAFVQTLSRPADFGLKASFFSKLGRWISGADVTKIPFSKPFGIALDENDNLCLADTGQGIVWFFNRKDKKFARWEKIGTQRFATPVAVAKTRGVIYVADTGLGSVLAFDEKGNLRHQITNHLSRPAGLAIHKDNLLVTDSQRHCVVVFDLQGRFKSEFGTRGNGSGQFNFPTHIASGPNGRLYVTDSLNARVQVLDDKGASLGQIGGVGDAPGQFSRPKGVALDSFGNVYVLDAVFDNLQLFQPSGPLLLEMGTTGDAPGQFWLPSGIAISSKNEIFVADTYNHRIQMLKYVGKAP